MRVLNVLDQDPDFFWFVFVMKLHSTALAVLTGTTVITGHWLTFTGSANELAPMESSRIGWDIK